MANDKHTTVNQMENLAQRVQQMDAENDADRASHINNTTVHITATERTNWNDANSKKHSHSNKSVLDGITAALITAWNAANTAKHSHSNKSVLDGITAALISAWNAAKSHADSAHAPSGAEVNQNAFSNIKVGSTTIAADAKTDTLEIAGSNVTVTPDESNDKVTVGITKENVVAALGYTPPSQDTVYKHPGYTARTGVPAANATPGFGGTFQVSQPVTDASGHVTAINSRTVTIPNTVASASAPGLMSTADKVKVNGVAAGATADSFVSISIPVSSWVTNSETASKVAGYVYYADVAVSGLAAENGTETVLDMGSINAAYISGVCPVAMALAGKMRYYAMEKPTAAISAVVRVTKAAS